MRKLALFLAVIMLVSLIATPAQAVQPRLSSIIPELSFNGTTATCNVSIVGNNTSEHIEAAIRLYRGTSWIATWYDSGDGYIFFSQDKEVTAGYTYKLTVHVTVNGVAYSPVSVTGSC